MTGSTVGPVRAALKTLWSSTFTSGVLVTYGNRVTFTVGARLMIGGVEGDSQPEAMGPQRSMQEVYDIRNVISIARNGSVDDQQLVTEQVLAYFTTAELAVRSSASQTLGVPGVIWAGVEGSWSLSEPPASETGGKIAAEYEFRVHVQARYQLP